MKALGFKTKEEEGDLSNTLMETIIKESSRMEKLMGKGFISGLMVRFTMESGLTD